jgi:hypothetical protein
MDCRRQKSTGAAAADSVADGAQEETPDLMEAFDALRNRCSGGLSASAICAGSHPAAGYRSTRNSRRLCCRPVCLICTGAEATAQSTLLHTVRHPITAHTTVGPSARCRQFLPLRANGRHSQSPNNSSPTPQTPSLMPPNGAKLEGGDTPVCAAIGTSGPPVSRQEASAPWSPNGETLSRLQRVLDAMPPLSISSAAATDEATQHDYATGDSAAP